MEIAEQTVRAIALRLRKRYPTKYKDVDITEGFKRPTLAVRAGNVSTSLLNEDMISMEMVINVYYFPEIGRKTYGELLHMQEDLRLYLANPIAIDDECFYIFSPDIESSINFEDKSLTLTAIYEVKCLVSEYTGSDEEVPPIAHDDFGAEPMETLTITIDGDE